MSKYAELFDAEVNTQGLAPEGEQPSKYAEFFDSEVTLQQEQARTMIETALKDDPEIAAERLRLSEASGVPLDVAARNLDELRVKERAKAVDLVNMAQESPILYRQLVDPAFVTTAIDDLDTLKNLEKAFTRSIDYITDTEQGLAEDAAGAGRSLALGATVGLGAGLYDVAGVLNDVLGWQAGAEGARQQATRARESMQFFGLQGESSTAQGIRSGLESAGQNLALMPLGLARNVWATANQAAAAVAGAMSTFVGAEAYNRAREQGRNKLEAAAFAIPQAGFEYVFEKIPASKLFGDIAADEKFLRMLGKQAVTEGWTEQVTTLAQDFNEWMNLNPKKTLAEFLAERPEAAYQTFVATLVGVGVQTSAIRTIDNVITRVSDRQLRFEQDILQQQMALARDSALRARSPEMFRQHIERVQNSDEGAKKEIYVDAEALNQLPPELLNQLPEAVRQQLPEALAANSTIAVPMADVLTVAPGGDLETFFNDNARVRPNARTRAEAQLTEQLVAEEADRVLQQAADQAAWSQSADTVRTRVLEQLNTSGRWRPEVNEAYATLQANFFSSMAARAGVTPEQLFDRYELKVQARVPGAADRVLATLDQGGVAVTDQIDDVTGLPLNADGTVTLYHHTSAANAESIRRSGALRSAGEPSVYLTTRETADTGYGDTVVKVRIDPAKLQLDDEFPDGRRDFSVDVGRPGGTLRGAAFSQGPAFDGPETGNTPLDPNATEIEVDGVMRPVQNSEKRPIYPTQEGVRNFWRWFGDSKVVDNRGRPLVVYHGSRNGRFSVFQRSQHDETGIQGVAFAPDKRIAVRYANDADRDYAGATLSPEVYAVYLKSDSVPSSDQFYDMLQEFYGKDLFDINQDEVDAYAKQQGINVLNTADIGERGELFAILPDGNIKSATGNAGTFDQGNANVFMQSATIRRGKETLKKFGLKPGKKYKTREVAAALEARQRAKYGTIAADDRSAEAIANIAKWMQAEVEFAMDNPESSGVGWYSEKFQRALDTMAQQFPELATDKVARNTMTALIAITSDGQKVVPNFAQAMDIYGRFRQSGETEGQFTTTRGHARQASIANNLAVLQRLYDQMGAEAMHEYLMQEKTIAELKKLAKANGGELKSDYQAHISMPMAAVEFGPKLGAFYANLMGAHGYLTMDRWWSRTFNRYRGTLLQSNTQSALDNFKALIGQPELSNDEVLAAVVAPRQALEARGFKTRLAQLVGKSEPGKAKDKAEWMAKARELAGDQFDDMLKEHNIERSANTIYKTAFENLEDAPFNATDRTFMLDAVNQAQRNLAKKGYNLSVADIQAILWYYEKRLYGELGARQTADISYEEAAQRVVAGYASGSGIESLLDDTGAAPEDGGAESGGVPVGEEIYDDGEDGAVLNQNPQAPLGTFNPEEMLITLGESANLSTFLHESGHYFLEVLADIAADPATPQPIRDDWATAMAWGGFTQQQWDQWQAEYQATKKIPAGMRDFHERWAESFEAYLFEGKAPSAELQPLFRRFRSWLINVYQSLKRFLQNRNLQMNDEIRAVFDRMLATDEQIRQAEEAAGLLPEFDPTNEAIEQLQARSLRDLRWTINAWGRELKKLEKEAKGLRKGVEAEVRAEVERQAIYRAMTWLKKGEMVDEATGDLIKAEKGYKLDTAALKEMYPESMLARPDTARLKGMTGKEGLHPDLVADMFGFETGDALVRAIIGAEPIQSVVDGITDQRMLERYGDLATPEAREEAANEAVHNEARARSLATELKAQSDMLRGRQDTGRTDTRGRPITVNALVQAAKDFGATIAARRPIRELKSAAWQHRAAEARAGKRWDEATRKGQTEAAVQAKRDQMLNNAAAKALQEAQAEVREIVEFFRRVVKDNNEKIVKKGRDPDVVNAMRAILAAYGVAPRLGKSALEYMEAVKRNDPAMYNALAPSVQTALVNAMPLQELTMEELRGLNDELRAMWDLAKRSRKMEIDGNLLDLEDLEQELMDRMQQIGIPSSIPGEKGAITDREERSIKLQFAKAILSRVEQWAERLDGKYGGPFLRLVFQPVKEAADRYRAARVDYRKRFTALLEAVAPMLPPGPIAAPELGYIFGNARDSGAAELLHAILHTGNQSNKRKLLLGRGWATENADGSLNTGPLPDGRQGWDAFVARLHDEGKLRKEHYDFAQGVWDLLEEMKPLAQATHRDVFGRYFAEVTADELVTPFGTYRGGYVPAQTDSRLVKDAKLRELAEGENESMAYAFPAAPSGFTKARVEYNQPLMLDLRVLAQHIDKVLLFSHMQSPINDVRRLLTRKAVSTALDRIDPAAYEGMLIPWLNRSARQIVETPVAGDRRLSRFLSAMRNRAGMSLMFANLSNAAQQITGFSMAAVKVKPGLMLDAAAAFIRNPKNMQRTVAELSPYMKDRMLNEVSALNDAVERILIHPNWLERGQEWTQQHAYFLQTAVDRTMSPIIWTAAYNQAIGENMNERDAARFADGVIRQTQGSTLPEDVSRFETGSPVARLFTQFVGYFNMMANTNATAVSQIAGEMGLRKGAGRLLYVALAGLLVPIWVAEAIAQGFRGGPDDEDEDGYLDDWLAAVFGLGTVRGLTAQVPVVGQFAQLAVNRVNDNPADDKFSLSPAVSLLESAAGAPVSVYKAIVEEGNAQKALRDTAAAATLLTGLPIYGAVRPVGYAAGVAQGKIEPTGPIDLTRGLVTGTAAPESRVP